MSANEKTRGETTYRAACFVSSDGSVTPLTGEEHAGLPDAELRAEALAEMRRADLLDETETDPDQAFPRLTREQFEAGPTIRRVACDGRREEGLFAESLAVFTFDRVQLCLRERGIDLTQANVAPAVQCARRILPQRIAAITPRANALTANGKQVASFKLILDACASAAAEAVEQAYPTSEVN